MPDVLAALDLTTAGVVLSLLVTVVGLIKTLSLFGPERTEKLMTNFEKKLVASEGEAVIWRRRAEGAEAREKELEARVDDLEAELDQRSKR